jgi:YegS/Rv2252/BmrU family lipid kinase
MTRRALVLVNRHSRSGEQHADEAMALLREHGFTVLEKTPGKAENLSDLIRRYKNEVDTVIVGGGDGSLNAAANGLVEAQIPLGILPLGTANDLARTLEIPTELEQACQTIAEGYTKRIDLGSVNDNYFFNVASIGLTVRITQQLSKESKGRWGVLAYLFTALQVLWQARPFHAEIRCNGESFKVKTIQIAVGNGRHYGGGMVVAEDAEIDDSRLDLYSLEVNHWWQVVLLFPAMRQGTLEGSQRVRTLQGREFEVHLLKQRALTADGEIVGSTPARFRLCPQALTVITPRPGTAED